VLIEAKLLETSRRTEDLKGIDWTAHGGMPRSSNFGNNLQTAPTDRGA
jgi:hypothetical protein